MHKIGYAPAQRVVIRRGLVPSVANRLRGALGRGASAKQCAFGGGRGAPQALDMTAQIIQLSAGHVGFTALERGDRAA